MQRGCCSFSVRGRYRLRGAFLTGIAIPNLCSHWSISLGGFGNLGDHTITATRSSDREHNGIAGSFELLHLVVMIGLRWMEEPHQATVRRHRLLVALLGAAITEAPDKRADCVLRHRLNWDVHKQTLLLEGQFKRCYRMDVASFEKLLVWIRPALLRDELQSVRRTGTDPIKSENMLQLTISWLAGSNYHTTRCLAGLSESGMCEIMHAVMDAIVACPELRIHSRTESQARMMKTADEFAGISKDSILTGCVGCVDGWLCQIRAPSFKEVPDVSAFFSGHYQMHELNVQAICDAFSRFTGYCRNSPGKVGDSIAFKKWKLSAEIMNLPRVLHHRRQRVPAVKLATRAVYEVGLENQGTLRLQLLLEPVENPNRDGLWIAGE
jgi:hypothetical protein